MHLSRGRDARHDWLQQFCIMNNVQHYVNDAARVVQVMYGILLFHFILTQSCKILAQDFNSFYCKHCLLDKTPLTPYLQWKTNTISYMAYQWQQRQ